MNFEEVVINFDMFGIDFEKVIMIFDEKNNELRNILQLILTTSR